jgi:hypothetical protein
VASPLKSEKRSVDLAARGVRVSRIRRDPPPVVKEVSIRERDERDTRTVVIGILSVTLILIVIAAGIGNAVGWSPRQYTAHF